MAHPDPIEAAHQGIDSALRAGVDLRRLVADLHDVATGRIRHVYAGTCPEAWPEGVGTENDRADPDDDCAACDVLRKADEALR